MPTTESSMFQWHTYLLFTVVSFVYYSSRLLLSVASFALALQLKQLQQRWSLERQGIARTRRRVHQMSLALVVLQLVPVPGLV